jgi:hypothetical protein
MIYSKKSALRKSINFSNLIFLAVGLQKKYKTTQQNHSADSESRVKDYNGQKI